MYKNKNIKRILIVFSSLSILLISFGLLFNRSNNKNNNVNLSSQNQSVQLNSDVTKATSISGVKQIALGKFHSAVLTDSGQVYIWGSNRSGQLGNGTLGNQNQSDHNTPQNITSQFKNLNGKIIQVKLGEGHSSALTDSGQVYTWGNNHYGQLGTGKSGPPERKLVPTNITSQFKDLNGKIIQIKLGGGHSAALSSSGQVYVWGQNDKGQVGNNTSINVLSPTLIDFPGLETSDKIIQVKLGRVHSAALSSSGKVYTWGENHDGQLGNATWEVKRIPTEISNFADINGKIIQISMGAWHSAVLTSTGQVYTWGVNGGGRLGNNNANNDEKKTTPQNITTYFPKDHKKIIQISMGGWHSAALSESGQVYTWGQNKNSQLGNGKNNSDGSENKGTPQDITSGFKEMKGKIIQISLSNLGKHSIVLTDSGQSYTWGMNDHGQLGNNQNGVDYDDDSKNQNTPQLIIFPSPTNIGAIVGGVIGGLVAIGLIGGLTFLFIKKKNDPNFRMPSFKKK